MRRVLRSLVVATAALLVLADASPAAAAEGGGGAGRGSDPPPDFSGEVEDTSGDGGGGGGTILPGSSATHCTAPNGTYGPIVHVPPPLPQEHYTDAAEQYFGPGGSTQGTWWMRYCGGAPDQIVFVPGAVDPNRQVIDALVELTVEDPDIEMSPDETRRQLVGLETWLWIGQWQGVSNADDGEAAIALRIDARPTKVVWDMGDGSDPITCTGGGTPYDPDLAEDQQSTGCSHVFRRASASRPSGRFTVTATVSWEAEVRVNGNLLEVQTAEKTSALQIRVGERQALNRTPRRT